MKKLITILLLTFSLNAFSQDDPADGDGTVPVDGGLSLLLAAGAAYGANHVRRHRKG
ncbi:MAG: PID-CTERM protein-sorting domain-containing protein [Chitinophagaceae bacterium]